MTVKKDKVNFCPGIKMMKYNLGFFLTMMIVLFACGKSSKTQEQVSIPELQAGKESLVIEQHEFVNLPEDNNLLPNINNADKVKFGAPFFYGGRDLYSIKFSTDIYLGLKNGSLNFVNKQDPAITPNIGHYAPALTTFYRIQVASPGNLTSQRNYFINLMKPAEGYPSSYCFTGANFITDNDGLLYLVANLVDVQRHLDTTNQSESFRTVFKNKTILFQVDFPEGTQEAKLTKVLDHNGGHKNVAFIDKYLVIMNQEKGLINLLKYSLENNSIVKTSSFHIHEELTDNITNILDGKNMKFFLLGNRKTDAGRNLEILKFDLDLNPLTEIVTDSSLSGDDGLIDIIAPGMYIQDHFQDLLMLEEDIIIAVNVIDTNGAKIKVLKINRKTGELDKSFHGLGGVNLPATSVLKLAAYDDLILAASVVGGGIRVRGIDRNGKGVSLNGDKFLEIPFPQGVSNFTIRWMRVVGDSLRIYGNSTNASHQVESSKIFTMKLKKD